MVFVAACSRNSASGEVPVESVGSYDQLVVALRSNGFTIEEVGAASQPFFDPEGHVINLDDHDVQGFEFETKGEATSAAEKISPDGDSIGTSLVSWVSSPHFFHAGKLVVLYVGKEGSVIPALEEILGLQIAGR